jgi:hypothetical protein
MFKKLFSSACIAFMATAAVAHAELIDQQTTTASEYAQTYANGTGINVYIEGAGTNQVITLAYSNYTYGVGYRYWRGEVPASAVTINGIDAVSVSVDTCSLTPSVTWGTDACGVVDVTFNKKDYLWKTNGVSQYKWGDIIYQLVGGIVTFSADATGSVLGISVDSGRAYMGKYNNVTIQVSTAN